MINKKIFLFGMVGMLLFAGGCVNSVALGSMDSSSEQEITQERTTDTGDEMFVTGEVYLDDALKAELEKTKKAPYYMVIVTENTGKSDEEVYEKFVKKVRSDKVFNNKIHYFRSYLVYTSPSNLKSLTCPDDMSISLRLAYPVEGYGKDILEVEDWEKSFIADDMYVIVMLDKEETDESIEQTAKNILEEYEITDEDKIYFPNDTEEFLKYGELPLILSKDKIKKMQEDKRVKSIICSDRFYLEDF